MRGRVKVQSENDSRFVTVKLIGNGFRSAREIRIVHEHHTNWNFFETLPDQFRIAMTKEFRTTLIGSGENGEHHYINNTMYIYEDKMRRAIFMFLIKPGQSSDRLGQAD